MGQYHTMGYLHTSAQRFNRPAAYSILNEKLFFRDEYVFEKLNRQYETMLEIETRFYHKMGCPYDDFGGFILWIKKELLTKEDAEFLTELSATLKNTNLYDYYKKEISLDRSDLTRDRYNLLKEEKVTLSQIIIENVPEDVRTFEVVIKEDAKGLAKQRYNQVTKNGTKKDFLKIDAVTVAQNILNSPKYRGQLLNSKDLEKIYHEVIKQLNIERENIIKKYRLNEIVQRYANGPKNGKKTYTKNISIDNYIKPNYVKVKQLLEQTFSRALQSKGASETEATQTLEISVFNEDSKKIIYGGKDVRKEEENALNDEFYLFLTKKMGKCSPEMKSTFDMVWVKYYDSIKHSIKKGGSLFVGGLGELSGVILLYYIAEKTGNKTFAQKYSDIWSAQGSTKLSEFNRADVTLENVMGIQIKNFQESSITGIVDGKKIRETAKVNLHPYQILDRMIANGEIRGNRIMQYSTAFANMSFNKDSFDMFQTKMEIALQPFLTSLANFNLDKVNMVEDTANIWLIGGSFLIPGSEILRVLIEKLREYRQSTETKSLVKITGESVTEGDEELVKKDEKLENVNGSGRLWLHTSKGEWRPSSDNLMGFHKMLNSNRISIRLGIDLTDFIYTSKMNFRRKYRIF